VPVFSAVSLMTSPAWRLPLPLPTSLPEGGVRTPRSTSVWMALARVASSRASQPSSGGVSRYWFFG
jgi:hypothetical protein